MNEEIQSLLTQLTELQSVLVHTETAIDRLHQKMKALRNLTSAALKISDQTQEFQNEW